MTDFISTNCSTPPNIWNTYMRVVAVGCRNRSVNYCYKTINFSTLSVSHTHMQMSRASLLRRCSINRFARYVSQPENKTTERFIGLTCELAAVLTRVQRPEITEISRPGDL